MAKYKAAELGREDLSLWDDLVDRSPHGRLFHHSWWLEATGRPHTVLGVFTEKDHLTGGIPLVAARRWGLKLLRNPSLTPYLGPVFEVRPEQADHKLLTHVREAAETLAAGIAHYDSFAARVGPAGPDLQGFLWAGFRAELQYTFVFPPGLGDDELTGRMHPAHRRELRKAERRNVTTAASDDLDTFLILNRRTFTRQGLEPSYDEPLVRSLWDTARNGNAASLFLARNAGGLATDGALCFHDKRSSYLVLAGGDPDHRGAGGGNLALLAAIRSAMKAGRGFDFEGSAIRGVEFHYRRWGARPTPVFVLRRERTWKARLARYLQSFRA